MGNVFLHSLHLKYAVCQPPLFVLFRFIFDPSQCLCSERADHHHLQETRPPRTVEHGLGMRQPWARLLVRPFPSYVSVSKLRSSEPQVLQLVN